MKEVSSRMLETKQPLYTGTFLLLCLSQVFFGGSFSMIIPELPAYLTSLGGEDYKGLIIALFTLSAGVSRPFSGKLSDTIGRMPVMIIGTLVCIVCSLLYPLLTSVAGFLFLRFLHGFSTGFKPTANTVYVADIVPMHKRGEAMGIMGVSMNLGASMFPPLGSYLAMEFSMEMMFYFSSFIALVSILILFGIKETLVNKQRFHPRLLKISSKEIIEKNAIPAGIVTALIYVTFGALLTVTPDQAVHLGLNNKGIVFTSLTIFTILSRLIAGRASDRYGRIIIIKISVVLMVASHVLMSTADSGMDLLIGAGALGFATGMGAPAIFAWVIDISPEDMKGRYMATVYIALELGIGAGAMLSAWIYANDADNFPMVYYCMAVLSLFAGVYLQFIYKSPQEMKL